MGIVEAKEIFIGNVILHLGQLHLVCDVTRFKPRIGQAVTTLILQPIPDGEKVRTAIVGNNKVDLVDVETRSASYLREDGDGFVFKTADGPEPILVSRSTVGARSIYLLPDLVAELSFHEGQPILIKLPPRVALAVVEVGSDVRDMPTGSLRPATLSNGLTVRVPTIINVGDAIWVSTVDGTFVSRAS